MLSHATPFVGVLMEIEFPFYFQGTEMVELWQYAHTFACMCASVRICLYAGTSEQLQAKIQEIKTATCRCNGLTNEFDLL